MIIPILDLNPEVDLLWDELNAAFQRVLRSTAFIMGEEVKLLEREIAVYLGIQHAVGLNSGTDAIFIALRALGIGDGDEVITTPFTFFATAEGVSVVGAKPVFVDIDPRTFNLNPALIEAAITPRTKAVLPVHLFGQGADMTAIMEIAARHNLFVVEDTAQAFGGKWAGRLLGTIGHAGTWSFFPSKNLGAYGDAGMVTTNDADAAAVMAMLRAHGSRKKYHNEVFGYNSRLDTLQAAILRVKLPHVDAWNAARRAAAARYGDLLADVPGIVLPHAAPEAYHVYHQYTIRVLDGRRDELQQKLTAAGIGTMVYYPVPLHQLPVYADLTVPPLPETESAAAEVLSLPMSPHLQPDTQAQVADALKRALR